jgi:hypothetical protein
VALLEEELDLVLADPGLGFPSVIGSQAGNQLLVLGGSPMRAAVGSSGQIAETPLAMLSESPDPLEDRRAGGVKGPGGLRDVLSVDKEEIDHGPAVGLGVLRVSQPIVVTFINHHGITPGQ